MQVNYKDIAAGLIFVAIGLAFCVIAVDTLAIGTAQRMGPGYFPVLAGGLVTLLGLIIMGTAIGYPTEPFGAVPWRGIVMISVAPIAFGICVRGLGLGPTIALTSIIACFASYKVGIVKAVVITAVLTVFCLGVFHFGLGLPIQVFGPWLRF